MTHRDQPIFAENFIEKAENVNIQNAGTASVAPKKAVSATSKINKDLNDWAMTVADAVSAATENAKYGRSTVINEALQFYRHFYSVARKLEANKEKVIKILEMI